MTPAEAPYPIEKLMEQDSTDLDVSILVRRTISAIGPELVAQAACLNEMDKLTMWAGGTEKPEADLEARLRLLYRIAGEIRIHHSGNYVQVWLQGMNPELNDRTPIDLIRTGNVDSVTPLVLAAKDVLLER